MNDFSKSKFESRMDERQEKIDALKEKYGSIEKIPLKEKRETRSKYDERLANHQRSSHCRPRI